MATYGNFETVGRIFSIGARSVYSARREGGGKDEFVVKVLTPEDVFGEDPEAAVTDFTQRATIQQKLTQGGSKVWVAVHEIGRRDGEVYYVTDRAASNAQQLVAGRVRTEGADLYRVVSRVVEALRELRAATGRAHANLKPANVLIDRTGDVAQAGIMLTDPSGAPQPNAAAAEHADVRDLASLIHELVLHVPFRAMGGYPVEDSPGWQRLGKVGPQWRALVNRMLDPAAGPGSLTLESLAGEIAGLKARPSGGPKPAVLIGAAVGAVVLLGGAAAIVIPMLNKGNGGGGGGGGGTDVVRFDQDQWSQWCAKATWAVAMREAMRDPQRRADLERDPYLAAALLPLADEDVELLPMRAAGMNLRPTELARIATDPPPEVRGPEGAADTAAALDWIARLEAALSPESWTAVRTLEAASHRLGELRWEYFAQDAGELARKVAQRESGGARDLVLAAVEAGRKAPTYDRLLAVIDQKQPEPDSSVVRTYSRVVSNNPDILGGVDVPVIEALIAYLEDPRNTVRDTRVASNSGGQTDPGGQSGTNSGTPGGTTGTDVPGGNSGGTTSQTTGDNGNNPDTTGGNQGSGTQGGTDPNPNGGGTTNGGTTPPVVDIGPDPRLEWDAGDTVRALQARLREDWVARLEGAPIQGATQAINDAQALATLVEQARALEWTLETRDRVREAMAQADSRVALLGPAIDELRREFDAQEAARQNAAQAAEQAARDHQAFVAELRTRTPQSLRSTYLAGEWAARRDEAIAQFTQPAQLGELRGAATRLERAIGLVESGITLPAPPERGPEGYDAQAITTYLASRREEAIRSAWSVGVGEGFGPGFDAAIASEQAALAGEGERIRRVATDLALAEAAMRDLVGWDERVQGTTPPRTLEEVATGLAGSDLPEAVRDAMGQTPAELAEVAALVGALEGAASASGNDRVVLEELVADGNLPLLRRLYAWRALSGNQGVTLEGEKEMLAALRASVRGGALATPRQEALLGEFDRAALARWNAAMEGAGTRAEYQNALDTRDMVEGGVDLTALSTRAQFNLGLVLSVQRLEALPASASDDDVRAVLQRIIDAADRAPALWQNDPGTREWIAAVRAALNQTGGMDVNVLAGRGPGAAGWSFQAMDPQASRIRYTRSAGGENLGVEFVRLDPGPDGVGQAVYVATTEVSTRFFGAAASAAGAWGTIANAWGDRLTNTDDSWEGPKVWTYNPSSPNRLLANRNWLVVQNPGQMSIQRPFEAAIGAPSMDMPVQFVTAPAARALAEAIGCRLPTSQEWQAARRRESAAGWNLRDTAWVSQRNYATARQSNVPPWPFPDQGAFFPIGRDVPIESEATAEPGAADGVLFFQPVDVGPGSTFRHIIGNVAEFVDDSPRGFAGSEENRSYRVIGGSAISAPELGYEQPLPLVMDARDSFDIPALARADVGFRLAFDAGSLGDGPPLAQQAGDLARGLALVGR